MTQSALRSLRNGPVPNGASLSEFSTVIPDLIRDPYSGCRVVARHDNEEYGLKEAPFGPVPSRFPPHFPRKPAATPVSTLDIESFCFTFQCQGRYDSEKSEKIRAEIFQKCNTL